MNPYNIAILTGRLTRDPEIRYTNSNKAVVSFTLACDDGKGTDGERRAQFIDCVAWEKTAEMIDQHFSKGDGLTVIGTQRKRTYEKDGQKHTVTETVVESIGFPLSRKSDPAPAKASAFEELDDDDGELPF